MKLVKAGLVVVITMGLIAFLSTKISSAKKYAEVTGSVYDFKINSLEGQEIDFEHYKGKNLLIVNTASKCGFTPQYADLEKLHQQYGDKVVVLGFPANNFLWQEPGSNNDIAAFCERNYGVTFQLFEKLSVKGGDQHPLFKWLQAKTGKAPSWNFCKYVVTKDGTSVQFFPSKVTPLDKSIVDAITQ